MVIGARGSQPGAAYIFRHNGSVWVEEEKLSASDGTASDEFGYDVAIFGDSVAVGARNGSSYVFIYNGSNWTEEAKLTASAGAAENFGHAVAISGDRALVGAFLDGGTGSAFVFKRDGGVWSEESKLLASDGEGGDKFGHEVALSEYTAVVGATGDDHGGDADAGSAYVFGFDGSSWAEEGKLTAFDTDPADISGRGVAVSDSVILVGSYKDDDNGVDAGAAYLFPLPPAVPAVRTPLLVALAGFFLVSGGMYLRWSALSRRG